MIQLTRIVRPRINKSEQSVRHNKFITDEGVSEAIGRRKSIWRAGEGPTRLPRCRDDLSLPPCSYLSDPDDGSPLLLVATPDKNAKRTNRHAKWTNIKAQIDRSINRTKYVVSRLFMKATESEVCALLFCHF